MEKKNFQQVCHLNKIRKQKLLERFKSLIIGKRVKRNTGQIGKI